MSALSHDANKWLQKSLTMMPGTKMPQWWPHGEAETADLLTKLPPKMRKDMEAIYGRTGPAQRQILMDFMYAAAQRNYSPGEELVTGMIRPKIELAALPTQDTGNQRPQLKLDVDNGGDDPDGGGEVVVAKTVIKTKSDIELHEGEQPWTGKAGTGRVIGVVRFDGDRPGRSVITGILGNPFCAAKNTPPKRSERIVVTKKGEVQHMLVHVKSGLPDQKWTAPKTPVVLDQIDCIYVPHVVSVMPGQPIVIPNSDATSHNVLMTSGKNGTTNESMPVKDMKLNKKMKKPELNISFKCSVHPWMNARLHVLPHPFHMVSDVEGRFEITGLPPGKYTLEAYHETAGDAKGSVKPVTFDVEVKADTSTRADVTVKAE